jgi:hypothetical protein
MGRPPKKEAYLRGKTNTPKENEWYVNSPEIVNRIDKEGNLIKVLSVMFAPVETIVPHGNESMIYFNQDKIKMVESPFKMNMLQSVDDFVKSLRSMADQIEMLSRL